ncbi:Tubulin epsilon and delta complex protein 1 domain-containing protein [Camponotus japonicus]
MGEIRGALSALCRYINSLINVGLTPEHLRLAKYDAADEDVSETLRNTLHLLSYHAAREKRGDVDFRDYDTLTAMKLHLAFLQYPAIEFYSLSRSRSDRNRDSLIALAWLLETQNVLAVILRAKLAGGVLGAECSRVDPPEKSSIRSASSVVRLDNQLTNTQLASILHLNARVNLNLREIDELTRERGSLVSKVHAASINVSGLPHLNVSESALTKRLAMTNVDESSGDEERRREFRDAGILLDTRAKWLRRRHAFLDWMVTVIQEHRKSTETNPREIDSQELGAFNSLLCQLIRKKLRNLTSMKTVDSEFRNTALDCPSRTHRSSQCNNSEAQNWLDDLNEHQKREEADLQRNRKQLADELEQMLKLIPSTIRV